MDAGDAVVADFPRWIPPEIRDVSGVLLNSGREAFTGCSGVYLLGSNPGGDPAVETETVADQARRALEGEDSNWSSFRDDSWQNGTRKPGTVPMQRSVLHLLKQPGLDPGAVPASNMVFVRSRREGDIPGDQMRTLAKACWPFHEAMIEQLGVRVIVCFGGKTSEFVCDKLAAHVETDRFVEANRRRWTSRTYLSPHGISVVDARHPSVASRWSPTGPCPRFLDTGFV